MKNFFWPTYLNLEKEFLDVARTILVDDAQLEVYSLRICDLIVRTVVEIESILKKLFYANGGIKPEGQAFPYFDTNCLKLLVDKWDIDKKVVLVTSGELFLEEKENVELTPLHNAHKRGKADWNKVYQGIKHDRANNFKKGKLKFLLHALAALYLLNIYDRDEMISLAHDSTGSSHDFSMGSMLFSVKCHGQGSVIRNDGGYPKGPDFDECVYLSVPDKDNYQKAVDLIHSMEDQALQESIKEFEAELNRNNTPVEYFNKNATQRISELRKEKYIRINQEKGVPLGRIMMNMVYDGVLNKNQY